MEDVVIEKQDPLDPSVVYTFRITNNFPNQAAQDLVVAALNQLLSNETYGYLFLKPTFGLGRNEYEIMHNGSNNSQYFLSTTLDLEFLNLQADLFTDGGFADYVDENGELAQLTILRVLTHELVHYALGYDDPPDLYNFPSDPNDPNYRQKLVDAYVAFNENPDADVLGPTIHLTNQILEDILGDDADYRTNYFGFIDPDHVLAQPIPSVSDYMEPGETIQRTKFGWVAYNGTEVIRTDSTGAQQDYSDYLLGFDGKDILFSGGGRDYLFGGIDDDDLHGGADDDVLSGDEGADRLNGGSGNDELFGGIGEDTLVGGIGESQAFADIELFFDKIDTDIFSDDEQTDILEGGVGDDKYYFFSRREVIDDQKDWITPLNDPQYGPGSTGGYEFFDAIFTIPHTGAPLERATQKFDLDVFQNIDRVRDADGLGTINVGASIYNFDADNRTVQKDYQLIEFSGEYEHKNTWGLDYYVAKNGDGGLLYYDVLTSSLYGFTYYTEAEYGADLFADWMGYHAAFVIENFNIDRQDFGIVLEAPQLGTEGNDSENLTPQNNDEDDGAHWHGLGGDDVAVGTNNGDYIRGDDGDDTLSGMEGNDDISGGAGNDTLDGGGGDDDIRGDVGDDIVFGGLGSDYIQGGSGADSLSGGFGIDTLLGGVDDDTIDGGAGNDDIDGGEGADTIFGGGGTDTILGGAGNDTISAGDGDDVIEGGSGDDILAGGNGYDDYVYRLGDGNDVIREGWSSSGDRVLFQDIDSSDVTFHRVGVDGNDLEARIISTGESLVIENHFDAEDGRGRINAFQFYSGETRTENLGYNDIQTLTDASNTLPVWDQQIGEIFVTPGNTLTFAIDPSFYSDADADALTLNATHADGSPLPSWLTFDAATGQFSGMPPADFGGALEIVVAVSDGKVSVEQAIALIDSTGNAAPAVENQIADQAILEDSRFWSFQLPADIFVDADGDLLQLAATLATGDRLPDWINFDAKTGTFTGIPPEDFSGAIGLEVTASDGSKSATAFFTLFIDEDNDPVFASNDRFYATLDNPLTLTPDALSANDADSDTGAFTIVSVQDAENCAVTIDANGHVVVTNISQDLSTDGTFTYTISDGSSTSTATVTIDFVAESTFTGVSRNGTAGNDNLDYRHLSTRNHVDMGTGDDQVKGGSNNDIYFYDLGDGADVINEGGASEHDRIFLSDTISVSDVTVTKDPRNSGTDTSSLKLVFSDGGSIKLLSQYNDTTSLNTGIEEVHFADGTVWGKEQLADLALANVSTDADDSISGFTDRDDTLAGGLGDDKLAGHEGNDTYVYDLGDGNDKIYEDQSEGTYDTLVLGSGIAAAAVSFSNSFDDVTLIFADGGSVVLDDQFVKQDETGVEFIKFEDGTIWTKDMLARFVMAAAGTDGDDTIRGFSDRGDVIEGGLGNDHIRGLEGNDTFIYSLGDGNDTIFETYNDGDGDRLELGEGILASEVTVVRSQSDSDDVTLQFKDGGSILLDEQFYETSSRKNSGVEEIVFQDGTVWRKDDLLAIEANTSPVAVTTIAEQSGTEGESWTFTLPAGAFSDADGDTLSHRATLADGSILPAWLTFDTATQTFSGTPPQGASGTVSIALSASDGISSAQTTFDLVIAAGSSDIGDTAGTAVVHNLSGPVTGTIDFAGDHDWYEVQLDAGALLIANLRGSPSGGGTLADAYVWLRDSTGAELASDDESGEGHDALLQYRITQSGTYYIDAGAWEDNTGTFTLDVAQYQNEIGETTTMASSNDLSGPITGTIDYAGDHDWYEIQLEAGTTYQFYMRGTDSGGGTLGNPYLWLHDATGTEVAYDSDGGGGHEALLTYQATQTGTFYLDAGAWADGTGTFTIETSQIANDIGETAATSVPHSDLGTPITGSIDFAGDHDWYEVQLDAGALYIFEMRGSETSGGTLADPYVWLRDSAGVELASDDEGGQGHDARLEYRVTQTGTYYIDAGAWEDHTGSFTLDIGRYVNEVGATVATASSSDMSTPITGTVDYAGDHDWYALQLDAGTLYRFHMRGTDTGGGTLANPYLWLHDATGTEVAYDSDGGGDHEALLEYTPTQNGTFYLDAGAWSDGTGTFTIEFLNASDQVGDTVATAEALGSAQSVRGEVETDGDRDWYAVDLLADTTYFFNLRGSPSGAGTLRDASLYLRDSSGSELVFDDDKGAGFDSLIEYKATSSGTYYLDAGGVSGKAGTFVLEVATSNDFISVASSFGSGASVSGEIASEGDRVWYEIDLQAGATYTFDLRGAPSSGGTLADAGLYLRDANGNELAFDDDSGQGLDSSIEYQVTAGGTYYLDATGVSDKTGTFVLSAYVTDDSGTTGADRIVSDAQNELFFGDSGNDTFAFLSGPNGHDMISDFVAGAATDDVIEFATDVLSDFAAVIAAATDDGSDTTITIDADTSIVLQSVLVADLHQDDFQFV